MSAPPFTMVRISNDLYTQLRDLARIHGVTVQAAAEFAVEGWIEVARNHYIAASTNQRVTDERHPPASS